MFDRNLTLKDREDNPNVKKLLKALKEIYPPLYNGHDYNYILRWNLVDVNGEKKIPECKEEWYALTEKAIDKFVEEFDPEFYFEPQRYDFFNTHIGLGL